MTNGCVGVCQCVHINNAMLHMYVANTSCSCFLVLRTCVMKSSNYFDVLIKQLTLNWTMLT